ncbi:hypothetical protein ACJX0J_031358, partial [Zea mays]
EIFLYTLTIVEGKQNERIENKESWPVFNAVLVYCMIVFVFLIVLNNIITALYMCQYISSIDSPLHQHVDFRKGISGKIMQAVDRFWLEKKLDQYFITTIVICLVSVGFS